MLGVKKLYLGSKCEIYSRSKDKWFTAEIINVGNDNDGKWYIVELNPGNNSGGTIPLTFPLNSNTAFSNLIGKVNFSPVCY